MPKLRNPIATSNKILSCFRTDEAIDILGNAGYQGVEIWSDWLDDALAKDETSLEKIRAALERNNLSGVMHCPLRSPDYPGKKFSICSKDDVWRDISLKANLRAIDYAHELGFSIITVHPGHTDKEGEPADEEYWHLQIDAYKTLTAQAEKLGVFIGLEPMEMRPKEFITSPEHAQRILHEVGSENLGITFDLIHAYTGGGDMPIEFLDWMDEQLIHVHVSGHSQKKTHVPFYMTEMDNEYLDSVFRKLSEKGYDGFISIEGHTKGLHEQTKEHQQDIVVRNIGYVHKELRSLHLE